MSSPQTQNDAKIWCQMKQSHEILLKYGYPELLESALLHNREEVQKCMCEYFQPTPKRLHLIEWLILQINPCYEQETNAKTNSKKRILSALWKLGVMPFSKHTKNLDYQKYVDGLLGYENAVELIFSLCELLLEGRQLIKSKEDNVFGSFLQDVMNNYEGLVNQDYDPYKISFPSAYHELEEQQFEKEFEQVMMQVKKLQMPVDRKERENECVSIFEQFEGNKQQFKKVYEELVGRIRGVTTQNELILKNYKRVNNMDGRTLKISPNLSKLYRQYKQKIKLTSFVPNQNWKEMEEVAALLNNLNNMAII